MNIIDWAWLVVPLGACRIMQLLLHDRLLHKPRSWALRRLNPDELPMDDPNRNYVSYLLECPWCMSVWVGVAIVVCLVNEATLVPALWVLTVAAISLAAVVIDRLIDAYASDEAAAERSAAREAARLDAGVSEAFRKYESGVTATTNDRG